MYLAYARVLPEVLTQVRAAVRDVDIAPGPSGTRITPLNPEQLAQCRQALADVLSGSWAAALVAVYPSQQIVAHTDAPLPGQRYHLPLETNDGCWVFSQGQWQQLTVGTLYLMDQTQVHGAVNWGATVRTHLILDTV